MSFPAASRLALKEWAVTERALGRGRQIVLLRKGGIREESREFRVPQSEFLIYPTYEHQKEELLKPAYRAELRATLPERGDPARISFSYWARLEEIIELTEEEKLEALSPEFIWTTRYVQARLHWKPKTPLQALLVRVYRLEPPQEVPFLPSYAGCKSWVVLDRDVPLGALSPVLAEEEFHIRLERARQALKGRPQRT